MMMVMVVVMVMTPRFSRWLASDTLLMRMMLMTVMILLTRDNS